MRLINAYEMQFCKILYECIPMEVGVDSNQIVLVVNTYMGSIRSVKCNEKTKVYIVSQCETRDIDGMPVIVSLLLSSSNEFGELDFWKVDDNPIKNHDKLIGNIINVDKI